MINQTWSAPCKYVSGLYGRERPWKSTRMRGLIRAFVVYLNELGAVKRTIGNHKCRSSGAHEYKIWNCGFRKCSKIIFRMTRHCHYCNHIWTTSRKTMLYVTLKVQSTLVISTSLISNNRLSRSENLVPVKNENLTTGNKILWKRGAISPLFHNIFNIFPTSGVKLHIHL